MQAQQQEQIQSTLLASVELFWTLMLISPAAVRAAQGEAGGAAPLTH
jgi:hypothetical protein